MEIACGPTLHVILALVPGPSLNGHVEEWRDHIGKVPRVPVPTWAARRTAAAVGARVDGRVAHVLLNPLPSNRGVRDANWHVLANNSRFNGKLVVVIGTLVVLVGKLVVLI